MKALFTIFIFFATGATALGPQTDLRKLDPGKAADRATLLEIVQRSSDGNRIQAAKILAKAGYMNDLLSILTITTSYNAMGAIAQTRDVRTIPVFEDRIRRDPDNRYLVGSVAYVHSPKASPILVDMLKRHPDSKLPRKQDIVGCILNAIVFNSCQDAIPILRERFAACGSSSKAQRKSDYGLTLLTLGDPVGVSWLSKKLHADIESKQLSSWIADRLCTICDLMSPRCNIVKIQDESIMTPLLRELVRGASSAKCPFARECRRVLRFLTRHDFPVGDAAWDKWYSGHAEKHPIYTTPLDRAAKLCIDTLRKSMAETAKKNQGLKWMEYFLGQPQIGFGAHNDFLWKLESHPEKHVFTRHAFTVMQERPPAREKRKGLGLMFTIVLTSRLHEPNHLVFKREFDSINLTVCLSSPMEDDDTKKVLSQLAERACAVLSEYEKHYQRMKDAEQKNLPDKK